MLKSRPVGKPAKLAGSGRKLTRAFTETTPLEDNESMKASKEICYGLAVFHATFGCDNIQESSFHGFSPHEIRLATDKSIIRTNQVQKEHRARGVLFTPYTPGRNPLLPVSSLMTASRKPVSDVQTSKNVMCSEKKINQQTKILSNNSIIYRKNKIDCQVKRTKKCTDKIVGTTSEINGRSIARKFVLPVRSAHSSRVIKPNKRFRDNDVDGAKEMSEGRIAKKMRLAAEPFSDDSTSSWVEKREESSQVNSDAESNDISGSWSSSISTASSSIKDEEVCSTTKGKVILRKAKLKVEPDPPAVKGPFSSGDVNLVPQKVVCGVCGAVRYYRYLKQARKFGIYSCESCRKFISRVISQETDETISCKTGRGQCVIPQYRKDPLTGIIEYGNSRCKACWLKMCLRCYCIPDRLISHLIGILPLFMRKDITTTPSAEMKPKKSAENQRRKNELKHLAGLSPSVMSNRISDKAVEKRIILAKNIRRKAEAIARKDAITKRDICNISVTRKNILISKSQPGVISKRRKMGTSEVTKEEKRGKTSVELAIKRKRIKKEKVKREEKLIRLHKLKGPRVKHVCRSASLVLRQQVATFTDTSPSKQKSYSPGKEAKQERSNTESTLMTLPLSSSSRHSGETVVYSSLKITEQGLRIRQISDNNTDFQHSGKNKSTISKHLIAAEPTEGGLLEGKARTLQDLTRQHYELINGATTGDDVTLISIDFWESYDPEEVCKTGFALIGIGDTFNSRAICFICGSAGLDKLIHCACCCEPYHYYCVEGTLTGSDTGDWWLVDWICARCTLCHTCSKGGGVQVACQRCRKSYHTECLAADRSASRLHSADRPWVCLSCLCCKSCNQTEVYKFIGNLPLCRVCFKLRQKGNFCPLCQRCYDENDFDTKVKMMECERCKCWVHAKCEGLSNEKYQILSILPDSVEFVCRICCKLSPAPWWLAVEAELKAGFLAVLKSLSKNRKACDLLKWSPSKMSLICVCAGESRQRSLRFPDISEQSDAESSDMRLHSNDCHRDETIVDEECLKSLQSYLKESDKSLVCDSKTETSDKNMLLCDLRTKYNVRECSVLVKNDDLHLKLDNDTISYQNSDEKPSQFSPHATSQSDSGIGSTDDELKSTNDQCFCLGIDAWTKTPPTLLSIKKKVNSNEYSSLDRFNKEMEEIINRVQGTELLKLYHQTLEDIFPWFNPKSSEVFDSTTRISHCIDSTKVFKAILEEKPEDLVVDDVSDTLNGKLNMGCDYYYNVKKSVDTRNCIFCKAAGEGKTTEEGRLLYCGQNEWVHTNCALWSNEVFEEIDGSLQNVQSAISRSRHIRCSKCSKKGASVGCCNRSCPEAYHFSCARNSDCIFFEDKSLFCVNHKNDDKVSRPLLTGSDFLVSRPVYVELERKKKKFVASHNVHLMIGSLTINNLGEFIPDLSDQEYSILPCNFQCTRLFWSSVEPWRLVQYSIKTKIVYTISDASIENENNFTIDHSSEEYNTGKKNSSDKENRLNSTNENEIKEVIDYILDLVCSKDEEDPQASADLLPPELKEAIFEDLPHDLLDGISMQDIFPKLMSFDTSALDTKLDKEYKTLSNSNPKTCNLERKKSGLEHFATFSQSKLPLKVIGLGKKTQLQSMLSREKNAEIENKEIKLIDKLKENKNTSKWCSKIIQIDGTGDCSSESSDLCSPVHDETDITGHHKIDHHTVKKELFQTQTCRKSRILQVDGVVDSCISSCSSSECGSPAREDKSYWKLGQLDGAMDFCNGKDNDLLEENPVKCTQCHRTYRTAQSFERHLQTCSVDYILSCSESDSSEEEKIISSEVKLISFNEEEKMSRSEVKSTDVEDSFSSPLFTDISENKEITKENDLSINIDYQPPQDYLYSLNNLCSQPTQLSTYTNNKIKHNHESTNNIQNQVLNDQSMNISNNNLDLSSESFINLNVHTSEPHHTYSSKPKTIRAMFECGDTQLLHTSTSEKLSSVKIRPIKTYTRRKKVSTSTTATMSTVKSSQHEPIMEYHSTNASPTLIIQQVPSHTVVPSYIESMPHHAPSNNIQYQYITTIDMQDKPQQLPLTIQLQPPISIQPVMPTVLGTLIQSNGVEQLVVNTATPTIEMLNQQPTNVYITNMNQPMYVGMETMVSNTVMSSSQFVSGMLTGSSYSATTTQVYQTAKPVIDLPQSYVVVNTQTNPVPEALPQTLYSSQHTSEPWAYNYQQTYKVKERTTYQQFTRQIIQEENNLEYAKKVKSNQESFFLEKPVVQEVTVEKTHSIHKTRPIQNLPNLVNNINPVLANGKVDNEKYSCEELVFDKSISTNSYQVPKSQYTNNNVGVEKQNQKKQLNICSEQNSFELKCNRLNIKNCNEKSPKPFVNTQTEVKVPKNQTLVNMLEKQVKPVITKVKINPNVKNRNFCVSLNIKTSSLNDVKHSSSNVEKISLPIVSEEIESPCKKAVSSPNKNMVNNEDSPKLETVKKIEYRRSSLKENKQLNHKPICYNGSFKKNNSVHNLSNPKLVYEISSQDGMSICSQDLAEAWQKIFEAVQSARAAKRLPPLPHNPLVSHLRMLGLDNNSVKYLIEQLPGVGNCTKYKPTYHKTKLYGHSEQLHENPSGCVRSEPYSNVRRKYDMFSWLASRHRRPPKLIVNSDTEIVNGISRRATSLNLPMAMRFRHLKETSKEAVGVFRSDIHGRGLFCLRDIDSGEMVIEYAGEVIRAGLTDKREHYYTSKGIGCYMFRIDDQFVVDATMHGNAARFINHSCEPNCYSRVVDILGKKHILIFALRKIPQGEELTYDYKFPLEDDKITCHCLSRKCRKYLN